MRSAVQRLARRHAGPLLEVDGGYGRYIGLSVLPSSIVIYGIVIMFTLNRPVVPRRHLACSAWGFWWAWPCSTSAFCKASVVRPRSTPAKASRRFSESR